MTIHRADADVIVSVQGQVTATTAAALDHILRDLVCDQGNLHVVVDVGGVSDADASGVAVLARACHLAHEHRATLSLVHPSPAIEQAFDRWRGVDAVMEDPLVC